MFLVFAYQAGFRGPGAWTPLALIEKEEDLQGFAPKRVALYESTAKKAKLPKEHEESDEPLPSSFSFLGVRDVVLPTAKPKIKEVA